MEGYMVLTLEQIAALPISATVYSASTYAFAMQASMADDIYIDPIVSTPTRSLYQ